MANVTQAELQRFCLQMRERSERSTVPAAIHQSERTKTSWFYSDWGKHKSLVWWNRDWTFHLQPGNHIWRNAPSTSPAASLRWSAVATASSWGPEGLEQAQWPWLQPGLLSSPFLTLVPASDGSNKGTKCPIIKENFQTELERVFVRARVFVCFNSRLLCRRERKEPCNDLLLNICCTITVHACRFIF